MTCTRILRLPCKSTCTGGGGGSTAPGGGKKQAPLPRMPKAQRAVSSCLLRMHGILSTPIGLIRALVTLLKLPYRLNKRRIQVLRAQLIIVVSIGIKQLLRSCCTWIPNLRNDQRYDSNKNS